MSDTYNQPLTPEEKKNLAKKRGFYAIVVIDCILAIILAWSIISIFVK